MAFARQVDLQGRLQRAVNDRPYKPTHYIHYSIWSRAGRAPPLPRGVFLLPCVGRGDPTPPGKAFPLGGGKVARLRAG